MADEDENIDVEEIKRLIKALLKNEQSVFALEKINHDLSKLNQKKFLEIYNYIVPFASKADSNLFVNIFDVFKEAKFPDEYLRKMMASGHLNEQHRYKIFEQYIKQVPDDKTVFDMLVSVKQGTKLSIQYN